MVSPPDTMEEEMQRCLFRRHGRFQRRLQRDWNPRPAEIRNKKPRQNLWRG